MTDEWLEQTLAAQDRSELLRLRTAIEELAGLGPFRGMDIEWCDFEDVMRKHGFLIEVPATEQFREDWGFDTMMILSWADAEATP